MEAAASIPDPRAERGRLDVPARVVAGVIVCLALAWSGAAAGWAGSHSDKGVSWDRGGAASHVVRQAYAQWN